MPDPKVVISIEGGLIQDIFHNVPMDITVIDWDHDQVGEDGDPHQYKFADSQGKPAVAYMIDHGGIANMETMPGTDCAFAMAHYNGEETGLDSLQHFLVMSHDVDQKQILHDEIAARDRIAAMDFVREVRGDYATIIACYTPEELADLSDGLTVDTTEILVRQQMLADEAKENHGT